MKEDEYMKVALIGPYPPPLGGISIHIKRMKKFLEDNNVKTIIYREGCGLDKQDSNVLSIQSYKKFIFKLPFLDFQILHFHTINKKIRILLGFLKILNKKIILSLHGESFNDQMKTSNIFIRKLMVKSMNKLDLIICSNIQIKNDLRNCGVIDTNIEVIPEYIKPYITKDDMNNIENEVEKFLNSSDFTIVANGAIRFYNHEDLYGIDILMELISLLKEKSINAKLVFALIGVNEQNDNEKKYYSDIKKKIDELNLKDYILIVESNNKEFCPILSKGNLFIRPTNTDGNSISLMEAIDLKVPCIASDVCPRPKNVVLFKNRDINDLFYKTKDVIENYERYKSSYNNISLEDNANRIYEEYLKVLKM